MTSICLVTGHKTACDYYRATLPAKHCRTELLQEGIDLVIPKIGQNVSGFDRYIFYRAIDPSLYPLVIELQSGGTPIYWDLDDNVFRVPAWSPASSAFPDWLKRQTGQCLAFAMGISVSTSPLKSVLGEMSSKTTVLPNLVSVDEYVIPPRVQSGPLRLMWAGSNTHEHDLDVIIPALHAVKREHGHRVQVVFAGFCPDRIADDREIDPVFIWGVPVRDYPRFMGISSPHVGLCPLSLQEGDVAFNSCKSGIKFFEYTMAGAITVATNLDPYTDVIRDGVTGWISENPEDWTENVLMAVDQCLGRPSGAMWENAREDVVKNHSWQGRKREVWMDYFRKVAAGEMLGAKE